MKILRIILASTIAMAALTTVGLGVGSARHRAPAALTPTTAHGANFLIESQLDTAFCIEVQPGTTEGRTLSLHQCGGADTQRWAMTDNADVTNLLVDSQGMCVDGHFRGLDHALTVNSCQFGKVWRFAFTEAGSLVNERNGKCLSIPGAATNAIVSLATCDVSRLGQRWTLAH